MKAFLSFGLLCVAFQFGCCENQPINFEDITKDYVKCIEDATGLKSTWWSLSAKHDFFETNERYKTYKIHVYENRTFDTEPKEIVDKQVEQMFPDQVDVNDGPTPTVITFREVNRLRETQSTYVENNLKFGVDVEVSAQVSFFSGSVSGGYEHESQGTEDKSGSDTKESVTLRQYTVNPYSEVSASTLIVKRKIKKYVTHEFVIEGYLAIAFSDYIAPKIKSNYKEIKDISAPENWKGCGSGLAPSASKRGVYFLPISVLADDDDLMKRDDTVMYYHVTEIKEIDEEKIHFRINGKVMKANKKKAFSELCS